ncbi:MAG: hypothetical protein O8C66_05195 [Candidatus Methanoperedens sp.]|nr:hypothetical protein [Candidatus Methanoperedens sp.]
MIELSPGLLRKLEALMQAVGMVNDHTTDCFRYNEVSTVKMEKL